ncbi:MAG: hypothetical protein ABIW38_05225 [Ferruginibacter sp.]
MKRLIIYAGVLFMSCMGLMGCYKDVILPDAAVDPDGPPQAVSFKNDIAPMLNTKCAISGCHVTGAHKPYLMATSSYLEIVNGGFVNTIVPKESILYQKIYGEMKEYIPSATDRQKIYDWIRLGALNN